MHKTQETDSTHHDENERPIAYSFTEKQLNLYQASGMDCIHALIQNGL